ncbi:MAG: hypothetical protein GY818_03655 [Planctomycetaceae bacterium]|nr:hypothetical protein [Planctomycetaceae bacterium]
MLLESKKVRVIFGWKILILLVFSGTLQAQQGSSQWKVQEQRRAAELAEMEALRKKLGGGVAESLGDLMDPAVAQKEFARELERLSEEGAPAPTVKSKSDSTKRLIPLGPAQSVGKHGLGGPRLLERSPRSKLTGRSLYQSIARKLDGITADLEEAGCYEEADSMRDMAESYWKNARKLQSVRAKSDLLRVPLGVVDEKK